MVWLVSIRKVVLISLDSSAWRRFGSFLNSKINVSKSTNKETHQLLQKQLFFWKLLLANNDEKDIVCNSHRNMQRRPRIAMVTMHATAMTIRTKRGSSEKIDNDTIKAA